MKYYKQYIRDSKRNPIGVMVVSEHKNLFGWSFCNPKDKFIKQRGTDIALGRMNSGQYSISGVPSSHVIDYFLWELNFPNRKDVNIKEQISDFLFQNVELYKKED